MSQPLKSVGRYVLFEPIASGGMATVHLGRLVGPGRFARVVAIKRLHPELVGDPEFRAMLLDEARLAASVRHANVASILDIVATESELLLVMDYVHGESLAVLLTRMADRSARAPMGVAVRILSDVLLGLDAAHESKDDAGNPLELVHRDVSPQNILVGSDGVSRIIDFGVAKAAGRLRTTRDGTVRGKIGYMPPEQLLGDRTTRRTDVYAASVVLWEMLTGRRLHPGSNRATIVERVLLGEVTRPSQVVSDVPAALETVVLQGLDPAPPRRFATAREMAAALASASAPASAAEVSEWVRALAGEALEERASRLGEAQTAILDEVGTTEKDSPNIEPASPVSATPPVPVGRGALRIVAALAGLAVLGLATFLALRPRDPAASKPGAVASTASAEPEPSAQLASAPAVELPPDPPTASSARAVATTHVRRSLQPSRDCRVPFVMDAQGHKLYKRECL